MPASRDSVSYTIKFAVIVCLACAIPIATAAVLLRPAQQRNQRVDRLSKVLAVAGIVAPGEKVSADQVESLFAEYVVPRAIDLRSGRVSDAVDPGTFDQRSAAKDPAQSEAVAENAARVFRVPHHAVVYEVVKDGKLDALILPIQGYGLWSTMYGYLALEADGRTVAGLTFYEHGETPGLGGEIDNPRWLEKWKGRLAVDDDGQVKLRVIKGAAGPVSDDPYRVDGLSGATITGRGVGSTIDFWLGPDAFGPWLAHYRATREGAPR